MRASGSNPGAARLSGINVDRWSWISLAASGTVSGFAGVLFVSLTGPRSVSARRSCCRRSRRSSWVHPAHPGPAERLGHSDILGHSSIAITGDIYGHVSPEVTRQAMDTLGDAFDR